MRTVEDLEPAVAGDKITAANFVTSAIARARSVRDDCRLQARRAQ
jgi:hypothetical protein